MSNLTPITRRVARVVLTTLKRIGNSRGLTLKKIHDYIKLEYPNTPSDIVKLNNTLQKALAFGAVSQKKGKYILGNVVKEIIDHNGRKKAYVWKQKVRRIEVKPRMTRGRKKPRRRKPVRRYRRRN